jgi:ABC-type amino acid transport substrate-binding protein
MRGVRFASAFSRISGIASFSLAGVFAKVMSRSRRKARSWLITDVRRAISRSRTRRIVAVTFVCARAISRDFGIAPAICFRTVRPCLLLNLMVPAYEPQILRVGIDDAPPVPMQMGAPESGDFRGFEVSLLEELAQHMGCTLQYRRALWSVIVAELSTGKLDLVCSAATVTAERAHQVDFCKPHLELRLAAVVRDGSSVEIDWKAARLGVRSGTTAEVFVASKQVHVNRISNRNPTTSCTTLSLKGLSTPLLMILQLRCTSLKRSLDCGTQGHLKTQAGSMRSCFAREMQNFVNASIRL